MSNRFVLLLGFMLAGFCQTVEAQRAVIVLRHAERLDSSTDSALSKTGEERAARLAFHLKDSGIDVIYTSPLQRTIKTAEPLARSLGINSIAVPAAEQSTLAQRLRSSNRDDVVLVVGHSNTIPRLLNDLGVKEQVRIDDNEYGDLFVVIPQLPNPTLLRLRF